MKDIFRPKFFSLLNRGIPKEQIIKDIFAGIVVGIVALPLTIAFAVAAGVSPEKGIITAIIAGFIISLLGGSRVQIGGPTGAFIVLIYGTLTEFGYNGMVIITIMAGLMMMIFGFLKLGSLLKFIPQPLIVGFTSGLALGIFTIQIPSALGITVIGDGGRSFIELWTSYLAAMPTANIYSIVITLITIIIMILVGKIFKKIPSSFVAIILITTIVSLFDIPVTTIETLYGEISGNITFSLPSLETDKLASYVLPALMIALLGSITSLLSAVVADGMISARHRSNTELIAQGIANIVTPLFGGIAVAGGVARTATNIKNGGRTPIAGITHSFVLLLILLLFSKLARLIPMSCLAGILIVISYNMCEWRNFISILKGSASDIIILLSTFFLTVLVDLTIAIEVGIVLSALLFMKRMSDNVVGIGEENIDADILDSYKDHPKDVGIYEISGPFFFASAKKYCEIITTIGIKNHVLIIRMRHVPFIDNTALSNLYAVTKELHKRGTILILSGVNSSVRAAIEKSPITEYVNDEHICSMFEDAVILAEKLSLIDKK